MPKPLHKFFHRCMVAGTMAAGLFGAAAFLDLVMSDTQLTMLQRWGLWGSLLLFWYVWRTLPPPQSLSVDGDLITPGAVPLLSPVGIACLISRNATDARFEVAVVGEGQVTIQFIWDGTTIYSNCLHNVSCYDFSRICICLDLEIAEVARPS